MVVDEDKTMPAVIADILLQKGKTLATAESCTGGYIAHLLTSIPGSSQFYKGGAVTYSNELKVDLLGVPAATLERFGAVSKETVSEMARGVLERTGADYAMATSGIMGPDGGTPEKPVGLVWVGLASRDDAEAHSYQFRFDRMRNMELSASYGLNNLRRFILAQG
jgi:nicotinamide-nucleotide amidase